MSKKITQGIVGVIIGVALTMGVLAIIEKSPSEYTATQLVERAREEVKAISVDEYKQMRADEVDHILLDVREQAEWDAGHIEDDLFIPRGLLEFKVADEITDKSTPIVVLCKVGGRAALAGQTLQIMGYTNVTYIDGGYEAYIKE